MWPFSSNDRDPQIEETLDRHGKLVVQLSEQIDGAVRALKQLGDDMEMAVRKLTKEHQDDYGRLGSAIEHVRQSMAGRLGGRPSKPEQELERQALELGRRVMQACATPEGALALAADLQAQAGKVNGAALNAFGEPIRNGR